MTTQPIDHTLKIMGKNEDGFAHDVKAMVSSVFPELKDDAYTTSFSKDKNYLSISVKVHAESKEQLDTLYKKLSDNKKVLMAL